MLRISSYDENGIVFLSEGQKNWPKKHQGIDLIFALFIFWTANFCPQFVPRTINEGQKTVPRQRENLITNKAGNSHGKENYRTKGTGQTP